MSRRGKLEKFAELRQLDNVFEMTRFDSDELRADFDRNVKLKGHWHEMVFNNENKIVLQLACGRVEYSVNMADLFTVRNFIGIDIKGARIWKGALMAKDRQLDNVAFLRIRIEMIERFFAIIDFP